MLRNKSDASAAFIKFKALVEKESSCSIKTLRTDRGGEFTLHEFQNFCAEAGIVRHLTAPYFPQQNGVVERRNQTVVAMTRGLFKEKNMTSIYWGEAVKHSVYLLNRLPTKTLKGQTPYEAWNGDKPQLEHIKIFGCLAHMKVPKEHTGKLDDRSNVVIYLGKEPGSKAHRLHEPSTGKLYVSRDVLFEENKGWTWEPSQLEGMQNADLFVIFNSAVQTTQGNDSVDVEFSTPNHTNGSSPTEVFNNGSIGYGEPENGGESNGTSNSTPPHRFRSLTDVYDDTEEIELPDEEMLLMIEEPVCFSYADKEIE